MLSGRIRTCLSLATVGLTVVALAQLVSLPAGAATGEAPDAAPVTVQPGPVRDLSTVYSDTVRNDDGSMTSMIFSAPVNYKDAQGDWQTIDNSLADAPGAAYDVQNAANSFSTEIPVDPSVTPVKVEQGGAWVSMRMHGLGDEAADVDGSTASFNDVTDADSVDYQATSTELKESINLTAPPTAAVQYVYTMDASSGLTPSIADDGSVVFKDADGGAVFEMPAGVMFDSAATPAQSTKVSYLLAAAGDHWTLTVTPDAAWLTDPDRVYPVTIDPSVGPEPPISDCFINRHLPDDSHCGPGQTLLKAGVADPSTSPPTKYRSLLNFDTSGIPAGSTVNTATVQLWLDGSDNNSTASEAYQIFTGSRHYNNIATWNDSGVGSWSGGDPTSPSSDPTTKLNGSGTAGWRMFTGMAPMVQAWLVTGANSDHRAWVLKQVGEDASNVLDFDSMQGDHPPLLTVNYTPPPAPGSPTTISASPGGPGYTTSISPTLTAKAAAGSAVNVDLHFSITQDDSSIWSGVATNVAPGATGSVQVPVATLQPGMKYAVSVYESSAFGTSSPLSTSMQVDVTDATISPDACPASSCISFGNSALGPYTVAAGATQAVDLSTLTGIWDVGRLYFTVTATVASAATTVSIYDPEYSAPVVPTFTIPAQTGGSYRGYIDVPENAQIAITNDSGTTANMTFTPTGGTAWENSDDAQLDDAESNPDNVGVSDSTTASDAEVDATIPEGSIDDSALAAAGYSPTDVTGDTPDSADADDCLPTASATDETACLDTVTPAEADAEMASADASAGSDDVEAQAVVAEAKSPQFCEGRIEWYGGRSEECRSPTTRYRLFVMIDGVKTKVGAMWFRLDERLVTFPKSNESRFSVTWTYLSGWGAAATGATFTMKPACSCGMSDPQTNVTISPRSTPFTAFSFYANLTANPAASYTPSIIMIPTMPGVIPKPGYTDGSFVRCDKLAYVANGSTGCIFPDYTPTIHFDASADSRYAASADFIHTSITFGQPSLLERHYWPKGTANMNRRAAKSQCRREYGVLSSSCDEYPFASTYQGCHFRKCSTADILLSANVLAGVHLGQFYGNNRMIDGDQFHVAVAY